MLCARAGEAILDLYAAHLNATDRASLAAASDGASGRDLRDVCEAAERRWAAKRVRSELETKGSPLPPAAEYAAALRQRHGGVLLPATMPATSM